MGLVGIARPFPGPPRWMAFVVGASAFVAAVRGKIYLWGGRYHSCRTQDKLPWPNTQALSLLPCPLVRMTAM